MLLQFARNTLTYLFKLEHGLSALMTSNLSFFSHPRSKQRPQERLEIVLSSILPVKLKSKINLIKPVAQYMTVYQYFGTDKKGVFVLIVYKKVYSNWEFTELDELQ